MTDDGKEGPPSLEERVTRQGKRIGDRAVRIIRPAGGDFRRRGGHYVATPEALEARGRLGRWFQAARRILFGARLASEQEAQERLSVKTGLAIMASDNISSSAYATEEAMRVLAFAGVAALALTMPIAIAVCVVLAVVVLSESRVIRAYPNGGGSYIVAKDNHGVIAGLVAASALMIDYVLTVAVSSAAGVAAISSFLPALHDNRVLFALALVALITLGNLRGIREAGVLFAAPTYVYVFSLYALIAIGLFQLLSGLVVPPAAPPHPFAPAGTQLLTVLLVLRAFASGSVGLTGSEAVANGVPNFRPSETKNAVTTLVLMGTLFGTLFLGITYLATTIGIHPDHDELETVNSLLTRSIVGGDSPLYFIVQISTAVILALAANTGFTGFPRLASVLADDRFMPRQFAFRGERLAFSFGILALAIVAALVLVAFDGSVSKLVPLYTIGVFVAFTLSQAGMVRHWWKLRAKERGWQVRLAFNGVGAIATAIVAVVVGVAKFALGAWMVLVLIPFLIAIMWGISRHYRSVRDALTLDRFDAPLPTMKPRVVVPVSRLDRATLHALAFAKSIAADVIAVHVADGPEDAAEMQRRWERWGGEIPLAIVESPYRVLIAPLVAYIDAIGRQDPSRTIVVVLPEFVPRHFWEYLLHNQSALRLKVRLFFRKNTVVADVPYHVSQAYENVDQGAAVSSR